MKIECGGIIKRKDGGKGAWFISVTVTEEEILEYAKKQMEESMPIYCDLETHEITNVSIDGTTI